jgi:hypothetical protein
MTHAPAPYGGLDRLLINGEWRSGTSRERAPQPASERP